MPSRKPLSGDSRAAGARGRQGFALKRRPGEGQDRHRVPPLHINGGGTPTRADAERESLSAIAFALEGDPRDYDSGPETFTLDVSMAPAARSEERRVEECRSRWQPY